MLTICCVDGYIVSLSVEGYEGRLCNSLFMHLQILFCDRVSKLNKWSFPNAAAVQLENVSTDSVVLVKLKSLDLYCMKMDSLPMHSFITACIDPLKCF